MRVYARHLLRGDVVGSGETVVSVSAGTSTPAGHVDVRLEKSGRERAACWRAGTLIGVAREPATLPGIEAVTERERVALEAARPMVASVAQRAPDFGLFGTERDQLDLIDAVRVAERRGAS